MAPNPFSSGYIAGGDVYSDRQTELAVLTQEARSGGKVLIYSKRRMGKTTLMQQLVHSLAGDRFFTVYADVSYASSADELVQILARAVAEGMGRTLREIEPQDLGSRLARYFQELTFTFSFDPEGTMAITPEFKRARTRELLLTDVFRAAGLWAREEGRRGLVILDEFQEITTLPAGEKLEWAIRSEIQGQQDVAYFFVGSRRSVLRNMFVQEKRAFYGLAREYPLREIPEDDMVTFLCRRFLHTGKVCADEQARVLYRACAGHTGYIILLARELWNRVEDTVTDEGIEAALRQTERDREDQFGILYRKMSSGQKRLIRELADHPLAAMTSRDFLRAVDLSPGGVQTAREALLLDDIIEHSSRGYQVSDPLFARWLRHLSLSSGD